MEDWELFWERGETGRGEWRRPARPLTNTLRSQGCAWACFIGMTAISVSSVGVVLSRIRSLVRHCAPCALWTCFHLGFTYHNHYQVRHCRLCTL